MSKTSWPSLGDVIQAALLIAAVLSYYIFKSTPAQVIAGIVLVIVVIFFLISRVAARQLRDPRKKNIPPPESFWRTLYFYVPPSTVTAQKKFKIMIVHDNSSLETAKEVQKRHNGPQWGVKLLPINPKATDSKKLLPKELEEADAVYFCWTEEIRGNETLLQALDKWTAKKTEIPLLIVNPLSIPYNLKFASMAPEHTGPAHLLSHSIARGKLWTQLATRLYRWSFSASILCLIAVIALLYGGLQLKHAKTSLAQRDYIDDTDFNKLATALSEVLRNEKVPGNGPGMLNEVLDKVAQFTLNDIVHTAEAGSTADDHISVFRKVDGDQQNSQESLIEVVGPHPLVRFYPDQRSIAGCSIFTTSFVLWEKGCKKGAPAAWDTDGQPFGSCLVEKNQEGKLDYSIQLDADHKNAVCRLDPTSALLNNRGILCYSAAVQISPNQTSSDTAVCLVTSGATDWLSRPFVRSKLRMFALVANSLPTRTLIIPEPRADPKASLKPQPNPAAESHSEKLP